AQLLCAQNITVDNITINQNATVNNSMGRSGYYLLGPSGLNGPFSFDVSEAANTGSARPNLIMRNGYKTTLLGGDHSFYGAIESFFKPTGSSGQMEGYLEYVSQDHTVNFRPFFVTIPVEGPNIDDPSMAMKTSSLTIGAPPSGSFPSFV